MRLCQSGLLSALLWVMVGTPAGAVDLKSISNIIIMVMENRSYDNLFGEFENGDGLKPETGVGSQVDMAGIALEHLTGPQDYHVFDCLRHPHCNSQFLFDIVFDESLKGPFEIDQIKGPEDMVTLRDAQTHDLVHRFYTSKAQIDDGKNDLFATYSNAHGLAMGHYSAAAMKDSELWKLAKENKLLDKFFMGAFEGSFLNHIYLICACIPVDENPALLPSRFDKNGRLEGSADTRWEDNVKVADGQGDFIVNSVQSRLFNDPGGTDKLIKAQTMVTIGDRLSDKGIGWGWYSGGLEMAMKPGLTKDDPDYKTLLDAQFQWHHHPFLFFKRFDPATEEGRRARREHIHDVGDFDLQIKEGTLPPVAFYKPEGLLNQHPEYTTLRPADDEIKRVVTMLEDSPLKNGYALIIIYDENDGFWDHVPPPSMAKDGPRADFFGPGTRIPASSCRRSRVRGTSTRRHSRRRQS
jgi:phospholipase C